MSIEPAVDDRMELTDGRQLAWAEFGDPAGVPLFFFHGLPGSRWFSGLLDADARSLGVRVVATDRPGFGNSDPAPKRTFASWPADIEQLADRIGLEKFMVAGISGGGAYTLSTAQALGERVLAAGVISGGGDISSPEALEGMHPQNRAIFELAVSAGPEGVAAAMQPMVDMVKDNPDVLDDPANSGLPPADVELLARNPGIKALLKQDGITAMAKGAMGAAVEACLYVKPWDFDVSRITVPVVFWHGDDDRNAPLSHARKLVDQIPHAELVVWTGVGHLSALERGSEILSKLLELAGRASPA